jgi:NADPH-dependent 2,4-dienoyl-CoA reductase/sulfur reductase-like enzyme
MNIREDEHDIRENTQFVRETKKLMNRNYSHEHRHAVVIGGSIAGLLAARVLAEHYEQVTLVERDALPYREKRGEVCRRDDIRTAC